MRVSSYVATIALSFVSTAILTSCEPTSPQGIDADRPKQPLRRDDAWAATVGQQLRDADHAFLADGESFRATVPEHAIIAHFDATGGRLGTPNDEIGIQTVGLGREVSASIPRPHLALGACTPGMFDPSGDCIQRLEFASPGVTEWWASRETGFEQGWTVDVAPPGEGELHFDVAISGAITSAVDEDLWLEGEHGDVIVVSDLVAWDATGTLLASHFEANDNGFRVVVDDEGAQYPITVDPNYFTPAWAVYGGSALVTNTTRATGDVNGDGFDDVIVAGTERAYVFAGSATGLSAAPLATLTGNRDGTGFGASVSGIGDVNGDGYADVVVGSSYYGGSSRFSIGPGYLYLGSATGPADAPAMAIPQGRIVTNAGDVNGDGYTDLLVGAPQYTATLTTSGAAYLYYGTTSGISLNGATKILGLDGELTFGTKIAAAGDVNGDGFDDVLVGSSVATTANRIELHLGSASGISASAALSLTGGSFAVATAFAGAGDVNKDGFDDVIVGSYSTTASYVHYGSAAGLSAAPNLTLTGVAASRFGFAVGKAGDVDNDGYADVIVGASYGRLSYIYRGSSTGLTTTPWAAFVTGTSSESYSIEVGTLGDINGDGYSDVFGTSPNTVYVYKGAADVPGAIPWFPSVPTDTEALGTAIVAAGDVNADGFADVAIGAPNATPGRTYIYLGSSAGLPTRASTTLLGTSINAQFGATLAGLGDVNGDGFADLAVGSPNHTAAIGQVEIFHGSQNGLSTIASATFIGASGRTRYGSFVGPAGDLNGDGYDDAIFAATDQTYVYYGSPLGVETTSVRLSAASTATFRGTVAGVGDIDNDGYDDLVAGESSALYVYLGSAARLSGAATTKIPTTVNPIRVARGGDLNGDHYADVVFDAKIVTHRGVHAYYGSSTGLPATASTRISVGMYDESSYQAAISSAGDINRDGYDDLVVARWDASPTPTTPGVVWVLEGSSTGISGDTVDLPEGAVETARTYPLYGPESYNEYGVLNPPTSFGTAATGAGDLNGDGSDDLLIAGSALPGGGVVYAYYGYDYAGHDADNDGYPTPDDCNDANPAIHPNAAEVCDAANTDEDCNGVADNLDAEASQKVASYSDLDRDGFGGAALGFTCDASAGVVLQGGDCNDTNAAISPAKTEICDVADIDEDCDGLADDLDPTATGKRATYYDNDADGYGTGDNIYYCDRPSDRAATRTDCNDNNADISPAASEICDANNVDENCNGRANDLDSSTVGKSNTYADSDGDGFGAGSSKTYCVVPAGRSLKSGDCNDNSAAISPGLPEICDAADSDENCNGLADNADSTTTNLALFYTDADADGFGTWPAVNRCESLAGHVSLDGDCDDTTAAVHPFATEVCNSVDDNCDAFIDNEPIDPQMWYADGDQDGYTSSALTVESCSPPPGFAAESALPDCDDSRPNTHPGAADIPDDGVDQDCDGTDATQTPPDTDLDTDTDLADSDSGDTDSPPDTDNPTDTDPPVDTDTDAPSDTDTDTGSPSDTDTDTDIPPDTDTVETDSDSDDSDTGPTDSATPPEDDVIVRRCGCESSSTSGTSPILMLGLALAMARRSRRSGVSH